MRCVKIRESELRISTGGVCRHGVRGLSLIILMKVAEFMMQFRGDLGEGTTCGIGYGKLCMRAEEVYEWM